MTCINGILCPIEKVYVESGKLFAEGVISQMLRESDLIAVITCPNCGKSFLIGQGHKCDKNK